MAATGAAILIALIWLLGLLGAPPLVALLPWIVPTAGMLVWSLAKPAPAVASDDDDDSWVDFSIRSVIVGEGTRRQAPARAIAAVLFGAPVAWALVVFGLSTLAGLF